MRAKVSSISTAQQRKDGEAAWLAVVNALSGAWGWTQTKLVWTEGADHKEQPITWRVSPGGCVAFFRSPDKPGLSLMLPYTKPTSATSGTSRASTLYHKGGYALTIGAGATDEINPGDGSVSIDNDSAVKVELFFDYIVEG